MTGVDKYLKLKHVAKGRGHRTTHLGPITALPEPKQHWLVLLGAWSLDLVTHA